MGCRTAMGLNAADEVYRDDRVVAVVAVHATNPGHLVVVTREHVRNALTMDDGLLAHMMRVGCDLGRRLHDGLPCSGIMHVFNNEPPCQTLFHAHLHVIPREPGDRLDEKFADPVDEAARAGMAVRIRSLLNPRATPAPARRRT